MKKSFISFAFVLYSFITFGQKVELLSSFYPIVVTSKNDTPNPVLIQADGENSALATIAINATQATATPFFSFARGNSNRAEIKANPLKNLLDFRIGTQTFSAINVNPTNNAVGINTVIVPTAQLDVNGTIKLGASGSVLNIITKTTVNIDLPVVPINGLGSFSIPLTGANIGSAVSVSPEMDFGIGGNSLVIAYANVENNGLVVVYFKNLSTGLAVDLPAMNFYITVIN